MVSRLWQLDPLLQRHLGLQALQRGLATLGEAIGIHQAGQAHIFHPHALRYT